MRLLKTTMRLLKTIYDAIWFRCHPIGEDADGAIYPSWYASWGTARILNSD